MNVRLFSCALSALLLPAVALAIDPPPGGGYPGEVTALGDGALNTVGADADDTAIGYHALYKGGGAGNTAVGSLTLSNDTDGGGDVAVGFQALLANTTGDDSVAIGYNAMLVNTTGQDSVAVGYMALETGTTGYANVACGFGAMVFNTAGSNDTAVGNGAMANSSGSQNTAIGDEAMNGAYGSNNTAVGEYAGLHFAGDSNIALGQYAGQNVSSGSNNIEIGNQGAKKDDSVIRIGDVSTQKKAFIAGINRAAVADGTPVVVNSKGQLGVATSSARFKREIKPMEKASEAILSLKPVSFRYKKELDPQAVPQFGLVAEEVAKVDRDLVARDEEGKPYTVRYEAVNAMLLNEFLKEHRKVEKDEATMSAMKETLETQTADISELKTALKTQAAVLRKVSEAMQKEKAAPRLVSTSDKRQVTAACPPQIDPTGADAANSMAGVR